MNQGQGVKAAAPQETIVAVAASLQCKINICAEKAEKILERLQNRPTVSCDGPDRLPSPNGCALEEIVQTARRGADGVMALLEEIADVIGERLPVETRKEPVSVSRF